jgi:hypothetical protein
MKVHPDRKNTLLVTYWGSDSGNRRFDILIEGEKIAEQVLQNEEPGEFFDRRYPIPGDLIEGKEKVNVTFHAEEGATAGGVFDVRILRGDGK